MVNPARATNVSSHATTADHVRGIAHQLPPRRTGRADFPHPALRQSLASKHLQGVDGVQILQVDQPIALQSSVQPLSLPKRLAPPLAPVIQKPLKPTPHKTVHVPKHLPRISVAKIVGPPSKDHIDFLNGFLEGLLISTGGLVPDFVPDALHGPVRRKDVQVSPLSSLQIPVIAQGESQKVQGFSLSSHSYDARLVPVHYQPKVPFQFPLYPLNDARPYVSSHNDKVVGISDQPGISRFIRSSFLFVEGYIHPMKIDISQQRGDHSSLRSSLTRLLAASFAPVLHHRCAKPHPDQFQDRSVRYPLLYHLHQLVMGNAVKVTAQIRVIHLLPSDLQVLPDLFHGPLGSPPRSKPMRAVQKIRLKDRLDDQHHRHLHHPVPYAGYPQGPQLAIGLRNVHAAHRQRSVGLALELFLYIVEKRSYSFPLLLYALDGCPPSTPGAPCFALTRAHAVSSTSRR